MKQFDKKKLGIIIGSITVALIVVACSFSACKKKQDTKETKPATSVTFSTGPRLTTQKTTKPTLFRLSAKEVKEKAEVMEIKDGKVIGEGGKILSKEDLQELAADYKELDKETQDKVKKALDTVVGEKEAEKIINTAPEPTKKTTRLATQEQESNKATNHQDSKVTTTKRETTKTTTRKETPRVTTTQRETTRTTTRQETHKTTTKKNDSITFKTETESYTVPYNTVDSYASQGGESRVYQKGANGIGTKAYKVKYVNGIRDSRELVSDKVTTQPQDEIIERYIKVKDAVYETRVVEDKDKPIYQNKVEPRWFVNYTDETNTLVKRVLFDNASDASLACGYCELPEFPDALLGCNWGTAEDEIIGQEIIGYEKSEKQVLVSEAVYEWKH